MRSELTALKENPVRLTWMVLSLAGLLMVFLFQDFTGLYEILGGERHPALWFTVKKFIRILLNDSFMLLLIYGWFNDQKITAIAWRLQLLDTLVLLPVYLALKLTLEGPGEISSPLLSQLHRLIVNPTIMILLIPAVYFQRMRQNEEKRHKT